VTVQKRNENTKITFYEKNKKSIDKMYKPVIIAIVSSAGQEII
jgi:hypothetical protein